MTDTQAPSYPGPNSLEQAERTLRRALNQIEETLAGLPDVTEVLITATPRIATTLDGSLVRREWSVKADLLTSRHI